MFDNITIPPLQDFLEQIPEKTEVMVEAFNNDDRKTLTKVKNTLKDNGYLIEYTYVAKDGDTPAFGRFVIENKDHLIKALPKDMASRIA